MNDFDVKDFTKTFIQDGNDCAIFQVKKYNPPIIILQQLPG